MTIRVAVIGAGIFGEEHIKGFSHWQDAEVVAISRRNEARGNELAGKYGVKYYQDYEEMLASEDVDVASICLPTGLHKPAALAVAKAGKHILLEKPMARTVAECDSIIEACNSANVKLMLSFTHHFHPELQFAKKMIDEGRLGEILLALDFFSFGELEAWPSWYYSHELGGGGEMMHDAVHSVDRMAWLIGSQIVEVYGRTSNYARGLEKVEDGGAAVLSFKNGAIASLFVNEATYPLPVEVSENPVENMFGRCELELHGTRGSIRYNTWRDIHFCSKEESFTLKHHYVNPMVIETREFLDSILEDREPCVGGEEGKEGIAVIQAIYESERRNEPVHVAEMYS
jgi:UDP-N-acetyl-2-amino-2-deoxyglucuronate dehydrogenase